MKPSDEQVQEWAQEWEAEWQIQCQSKQCDSWEWFGRKNAYIAHKAYAAGRESMREEAAKVCDGTRYSGYCPPEDGAAPDYYNSAADDCAGAIRALPISEE